MALLGLEGLASAQTPNADSVRGTYGHAPPAAACATEEFIVEFATGETQISDAARAQLQADLRHPRACNVEAVYLAAYEPGALNVVRDLLMAEGLPEEIINTIQLSVPVAPMPYEVEHVRVTFIYH